MLYRLFKWLFFFTVNGYFRSIHIVGKSNIPEKGPVIFVANHSSAFMDPILLAVYIQRPIYFLARGESFTSKFVTKVFGWLHMIPIYKPDVSPDEVHKNKEIFQRCFDHLGNGKTIMIFPEGISKTERKLRPIKTGTSRIALGAEEINDFGLDVKIIPIGINYSNPHYFRSDVFVNFGSPIDVNEYESSFHDDQVATVNDLTGVIKTRLEEMIVLVNDQSMDQLIQDIERLYRNELREESRPEHRAAQDFYLSKEIVQAVSFNKQIRPKVYLDFKQRIRHYFESLDRLNIRDMELRKPILKQQSAWSPLVLILGLPIFIYGYLVNIVPYKIAEILSREISVRKDFIGSMKLAFGMFVFLICYIIEVLLFGYSANFLLATIFTITLYPSGVFAVYFINHWYRSRRLVRYLFLKSNSADTVKRLHSLRNELLDELETGRQLYLDTKGN